MLKSLHIQNVALITDLEIEFGEGLNVLTGETGAGKSIIIGSLNFILGMRLDKTVIRHGANMSRVDAVFSALGEDIEKITELTGVEFIDNEIIISRTLKTDGKGECRINGTVVAADTLRGASQILINIHGQHETEELLKPKNHVAILDNFGGQHLLNLKKDYLDKLAHLNELKKSLKTFGGDDFERKRLVDMYQYQIKDIEDAKLHDNEDVDLTEKKTRLQNFEKLSVGLQAAASAFEGDTGLDNGIHELLGYIGGISSLDKHAEKFYETAKSLRVELNELAGDIQNYYDNLEFDEDEFKRVDARLDEIKVLKRKYGSTIPEIFSFLNDTRASLDLLTRSSEDVEKINKEIEETAKSVESSGEKLVLARRETADTLQAKMTSELKDLGMANALFECTDITVEGVNFMFSANAGVPPRPLVNIISGGEMSRFMLALKSVTANMNAVGTLVFDEIDTGIGGEMGHKIAGKMVSICRFQQIIAVTHLAQIAAKANQHFLIMKEEVNNKTLTSVFKLNAGEAKQELTRMVGGEEFVAGLK